MLPNRKTADRIVGLFVIFEWSGVLCDQFGPKLCLHKVELHGKHVKPI